MQLVVLVNFLMFAVLDTTYGSSIYEIRYLIPLFLMLVINVGGSIDALNDELIFKRVSVLGILLVILFLKLYNNYHYINTKNNYSILCQVVESIEKYDVDVVYVYGDEMAIDGRNLRVVDNGHVYKWMGTDHYGHAIHWGDYSYYDDAESVGKNVLITNETLFSTLPEEIQEIYTYQETVDKFNIYIAEKSKFDLAQNVRYVVCFAQ